MNDLFERKKIPGRGNYTENARQERLKFLRQQRAVTLNELEKTTLNPQSLVHNTEAFIGSVEIPVGIAGPLQINGQHANGIYFIPLATTEGALVASATRGATLISNCGGAYTEVIRKKMNRTPLFIMKHAEEAPFFVEWIKNIFDIIKRSAESYSNHAKLVEMDTLINGDRVYVEFIYETGDAAGQNMTTVCTWHACQLILKNAASETQFHIDQYYIESNLSSDKKVSQRSLFQQRGTHVKARCLLSAEKIQHYLKVNPETFLNAAQYAKEGAQCAGMVGFNINLANTIAAIFAATGQDIASVHESSVGIFSLSKTESGQFEASIELPSLVIGTVGGGTHLPAQQDCLNLLDSNGKNRVTAFAEIIAAACLSLELSTLAAIASDQFARAHDRMGRNRPSKGLKPNELNHQFFEQILSANQNHSFVINDIKAIPLPDISDSITTELSGQERRDGWVGLMKYEVSGMEVATAPHSSKGQETTSIPSTKKFFIKSKPKDEEVLFVLQKMISLCDASLIDTFEKHKNNLAFKNCHLRELSLFSENNPRFTQYIPNTYHVWKDEPRDIYLLVQEDLENAELLNSINMNIAWNKKHIEQALKDIADIHACWYRKEKTLCESTWHLAFENSESMLQKKPLWGALTKHAQDEFPHWFKAEYAQMNYQIINELPQWYKDIDQMPKTLIHNDFNPRNIAFKRKGDAIKLCAFDWELSAIGIPQRDLAELLAFTLSTQASEATVSHYIQYHRQQLERFLGVSIDPIKWRKGYFCALKEFTISRLPFYTLGHTFKDYVFLEKVCATTYHLLVLETQFVQEKHEAVTC